MKIIQLLSFIIFSVFFLGCTSQEDQFKELAVKLAEKERQVLFVKEANAALRHSEVLFEGYIKAMSQKSEIKIKEIKVLGADSATAQVEIHLPSIVVRQALLGIANRVDHTKTRRFNYTEAMGLLKKQGVINSSAMNEQILKVYRFKRGADGWTILKGE